MLEGVLDRTKFKHNPDKVKKYFDTKGDIITVNKDLYILFPERYLNKNLAEMGPTVNLLSIYAVMDNDYNYGTVVAPTFMEVSPINATDVIIDGVVNKCLEFNAGDVFVANRNLIMDDKFMYDLFDEFFLQGKIPWYLTYNLVSDLFVEADKYAGSGIGKNPLAMELLASIIGRDEKDKTIQYRQVIKSSTDTRPISYVGLSNVYYSFDNTLSKVLGGYMQQGVTTSIVNKEKKTTTVSSLLRS